MSAGFPQQGCQPPGSNMFRFVFAVLLMSASAFRASACDVTTVRDAASFAAIDTESVAAFYESTGGCAWDDAADAAMMSAVRGAADDGLDPALFHADLLEGAAVRDEERDVLLTDAAIKYAVALTRGLSAPRPEKVDQAMGSLVHGEVIDGLARALGRREVGDWLSGLVPTSEAYSRLRSALAFYRAIAAAGGWDLTPAAVAGKRRGKLIPALRRRLAMEGDLTVNDGSARFDESLRAAVERFQRRNGLRADGKVNTKTIERLNVSASQRVAQIALNLERLRLQGVPTPTRVEVNAPAATAVLYREGAVHLAMNAVVGSPGNDTPSLSSAIDTIILNPTWTVPQSIIRNEIKPAIRRDRDYLTKNRMYWAGEQLVQEPGPHNALGRIKFDFPNPYSVYLHDTPARRLFLDPERAQSHGCVRLEKPLELATELLRDDPEWDREAIEQAIRDGATRRIPLGQAMPVIIVYHTAFVDDEGLTHFRPDIYGLDTQLTLAMSQRAVTMRSEGSLGSF